MMDPWHIQNLTPYEFSAVMGQNVIRDELAYLILRFNHKKFEEKI